MSPGAAERPRGRSAHLRSTPHPRRRFPAGHEAPGRWCDECLEPGVRTVLIAFGGRMLMKELCQRHLFALLEGARESP